MRRTLVVFALAAIVLAACGDDSATSGATAATDGPVAAAPSTDGSNGSAPAVPAALDFSAPQVGGEPLDFRDYAGQTVALWFWAPT